MIFTLTFIATLAVLVLGYKLFNSYVAAAHDMQARADRIAMRAKLDGNAIGGRNRLGED